MRRARRHATEETTPGLSRRRRIALVALVVLGLLVFPSASFSKALAAPGSATTGEKAVEWLRDHGGGGIVNSVEAWWFSNNAPPEGGEPDHAIAFAVPPTDSSTTVDPKASATTSTTAKPVATTPPPRPVAPVGGQPLANEGVWQPVGPTVVGAQPMFATQVRPDAVHTSLLDGLVWMDPKLVRFELHPGLQEPGGGPWTIPAQVPMEQRLGLLAAFNGGFRTQDSNGGFYLEGRSPHPLRDGAASLVVRADGSVTVGQWGRDVVMGPDVVSVRQNLDLIVDGGQPVDGLNDNVNGRWGATLGNKVLVWRSAVCVDANGGLVYGYGNGLGALSLAVLMQRAGCQRAMELDINSSWTTFNLFAAAAPGDPASVKGSKLLPDQSKGGDRYLSNDSRDFVAVLAKPPNP